MYYESMIDFDFCNGFNNIVTVKRKKVLTSPDSYPIGHRTSVSQSLFVVYRFGQ